MVRHQVTAWKFHLSVLEALFTPRARHSGKDVTERAGLQISGQSLHERDGEVGEILQTREFQCVLSGEPKRCSVFSMSDRAIFTSLFSSGRKSCLFLTSGHSCA